MNKSLNILYVEDDLLARDTVCSVLTEFYPSVLVASSAKEALRQVEEHPIDVMITDIGLPAMSGMELTQRIREQAPDLPVIITSAYREEKCYLEAIRHGVKGYLTKPINLNELLELLQKLASEIQARRNQRSQAKLNAHYKNVADQSLIVFNVNTEATIEYANDRFIEVTGYTREELLGTPYMIGNGTTWSNKLFLKILTWVRTEKKLWRGVIRNQTRRKKGYYVKTTVTPIMEEGKEPHSFMVFQTVITEVIHPKQLFIDYLEMLKPAYVVLIKIENFSDFEDTLFQGKSHEIHQEFADQIFLRLPDACAFSKIFVLDNGEFGLVQGMDALPQEVGHVTHHLHQFHQAMNRDEILLNGFEYGFSTLMSLAYGEDAFENAKMGLSQLVGSTRNFIVANGLKGEKDKRVQQLAFLKKTIENYNVISHFQPIVNNRTQQIEKYESLVRFVDEDQNILSPYLFLKLSKTGKYYDQITSIVLENSFEALERTDVNIGINFSALDIEKEETQAKFIALLNLHCDKAHRVILELTEEENIENFVMIKAFLHRIKGYGVQIAIDDFGVGYSNFERVLDYEPDILKIDGKLIRNLQHDNLAYSIVESIVHFAQKEHLKTVAEYVESEDIYRLLCEMGVDYSQGYFFGKPDAL